MLALTTEYEAALLLRFEQRVERVPFSGCWIWTGGVSGNSYGEISVNNRMCSTHRLSWELFCGGIPGSLLVLHRCDVKLCVNPDHLYLGSHSDNIGDRLERQHIVYFKSAQTHCKRGHILLGDNLDLGADNHRRCKTCRKLRRASLKA